MNSPWPRFRVWVPPVPKTDSSSSFAPVLQYLSSARSSVLNRRVAASSCKGEEQLPSISVAQTTVCELVDHVWFESYGNRTFADHWRIKTSAALWMVSWNENRCVYNVTMLTLLMYVIYDNLRWIRKFKQIAAN